MKNHTEANKSSSETVAADSLGMRPASITGCLTRYTSIHDHERLATAIRAAVAPNRLTRRRRHLLSAICLPAVLALGTASALAQDTEWTGAVDDDWFEAGNWSDGVPENDDDVLIDTDDPNATVVDADESADLGNLSIGQQGTGELTIQNSGAVNNTTGYIGRDVTGEGEVTVTGEDSTWTNSGSLFVGDQGDGTLNIEDGGSVSNGFGFIGFNQNSTGEVTVTGEDSTWINISLTIGDEGDGTLNIEDGGSVSNVVGHIGTFQAGVGMVTVTGEDSTWTNSSELTVGDLGDGTLNIEDGGAVSNDLGYIGRDETGVGEVTVTGAGSTWTNSNNLFVGVSGGTGILNIENGGLVSNTGTGWIGNFGGEGTVTVTGADSTWTNSNNLILGANEGDGTLSIEDGGLVTVSTGVAIGRDSGSTGMVTVTGEDASENASQWDVNSTLTVGAAGNGTLNIEDGGLVNSDNGNIGFNEGGVGTVTVTGEDSTWNSTNLIIGTSGTGTLTIEAGGVVSNTEGRIGLNPDSEGEVTVTGTDSTWTNNSFLFIGDNGTGTLNIEDGGTVSNTFGSIGWGAGSEGTVTVTGAGSTWTNSGDLRIGISSDGTLNIEDGGTVSNTFGVIGAIAGSEGEVTVTGTGSQWNNDSTLRIGFSGTGTLTIEDGGVVSNTDGSIGEDADGDGTVTVTGAGSQWNNDGSLTVGKNGTGTLTIEAGGVVSSDAGGRIGETADNEGTVTVTGAGSQWNNDGTLRIGVSGTGTLTIEDGGVVSNTVGRIGDNADGDGTVTVTGTDSEWTNSAVLTVGQDGTGALDIEDGGAVNNLGGRIGLNADSDGTVTVTGAGSEWTNNGDLTVGQDGTGTLTIGTGAEVSADSVTVAQEAGSSGTALVNGTLTSSSVVVNSGGWLGGDGMINGNTTISGTVAPGNSTGILSITGTLIFETSSVYIVEVNDGGNTAGVNNDYIDVGGIAIINGGTVHVTPENLTDDGSTYAPETTYRILSADGGVTGEFDAVTDDFAFLSSALSYDPTNVFLTLSQVADFDSIAQTPNQLAVATTLDNAVGTGNLDDIINNLIVLDDNNAQQALDSLSGVQHTHAQHIGNFLSRQFQSLLFSRMDSGSLFLADAGGVSMAFNGERWAHELDHGLQGRNAGHHSLAGERGVWLRGYGGFGDIDGDINATGADFQHGGVALGVDANLTTNTVIGIAAGYTRSDANTAAGDLDVDSVQAGVYAGWSQNQYYLNGNAGFGYHWIDSSRRVTVGGMSEQAKADYDAYHLHAAVEGGRDFALTEQTTVTPFIGLDYTYLNRDSFSESGAGTANLVVRKETQDSLRTSVGARLSHEFTTERGMAISPSIEAAWVHEHLDRDSRLTAGFAGAPGATFDIAGPKLDRNRARVGAGVTAQLTDRSSLNVSYQGEVAGSDDHHTFGATYRMSW